MSQTKIKVKLQNIVATADIGHSVDLECASSKLPHVIYKPEQFPGAIYYAKELEGASILIFANGRVVFAGLKKQVLLEEARSMLVKLAEFIVDESYEKQ